MTIVHDPVNELYDAACELLVATQHLQDVARVREARPAMPATLGCLAAAFAGLADACDELAQQAERPGNLDDAAGALIEARRACVRARAAESLAV